MDFSTSVFADGVSLTPLSTPVASWPSSFDSALWSRYLPWFESRETAVDVLQDKLLFLTDGVSLTPLSVKVGM